MATNHGIQPDPKKVYLYRLYSLVTDGGGLVYRSVFTDYATRMSGSVANHIETNQCTIRQSFMQKVITRVQYDKLFPNRHPASVTDSFDLTLLAFLVRVTCVEETADEDLRKRVADLEKLKTFRNEIAHIHSTEEYDETKFETFWRRIRSAILQLGEGIPGLEEEIDKLKSDPIDPHREAELQEMIIDLRRRVECAQELSTQIESRLQRLELGQKRLEQSQTRSSAEIHTKLDDAARTQENQNVLLRQLHKIAMNPSLQLPSPGDFQSDFFAISLYASRNSSITHVEQTQQYAQRDDNSGCIRYMEKYQKMMTKGTVTALETKDYEDLSNVIGVKWPSLAHHLGLSDSQIERIRTSFQRNDIQGHIVEMVRFWGETEKEHATIYRLINAVLECPVIGVDECAFEDIINRHIKSP